MLLPPLLFPDAFPIFQGAFMQKGHGLGNILRSVARTFRPLLKKGMLKFGETALKTGMDVVRDIEQGENIKSAVKNRTIQNTKQAIKSATDSLSSSRKRSIKREGGPPKKKKKAKKITLYKNLLNE